MKKLASFILLLNIFNLCSSQTPLIRNYAPEEYNAETQNWTIAQDKNGLMYFGNNSGLLTFDGLHWDLLPTPVTVRSMSIANDNKIYAGLKGDIGYFKTTANGTLQLVSLKNKIPVKHRQFNNVWRCFTINKKVYFNSYEKLFVYTNDTVKVYLPKESFFRASVVNKTLYLPEPSVGIKMMVNDSLRLLRGSEFFINKKVYMILPYNQNFIMVLTTTDGIVLYSHKILPKSDSTINEHIVKPKCFSRVNEFLISKLVYYGAVLKNGNYVLGTTTAGLIVIDKNGEILQRLNKQTGLQDNSIYNLFEDQNRQLWIGGGNGISLYQFNPSFEVYSQNDGLQGSAYCMNIFDNQLYVGTSQKLFVQNKDKTFSAIEHTEGQNFSLTQINGKLYDAINFEGVMNIEKSKAYAVAGTENMPATLIQTFKNQPEKIWIGSVNGIFQTELKDRIVKSLNKIKGFSITTFYIVLDTIHQTIWLTNEPQLYKIQLNKNLDSAISVIHCDTTMGLFSDKGRPYRLNNNEIIFATETGIYYFDYTTNKFKPHELQKFIKGKISYLCQDAKNNIWFEEFLDQGSSEKGVLWWKNGHYEMDKTPFYKFSNLYLSEYYCIYPYSDSIIYFGTNKGLLAYFPKKEAIYNNPFNTIIHKVYNGDSLLYFGAAFTDSTGISKFLHPVLSYKNNHIIFEYACTYYEDAERNLYQSRLIGLDTTWSGWSKDSKKEYMHLPEGSYVFEVNAKNIYRKIGKMAKFSFTIKPPWYRTIWAYLLYFISSAAFIWFVVRLNTRRLKAANVRLEEIVLNRTAEILQQKEEIEAQTEELTAVNEELEKLSIVASETDNGVIIMDADFNFEWVNDGFSKLYGYNFSDMSSIGKNNLLTSSYAKIKEVTTCCKETKKTVQYENKVATSDNRELWVQTTLTPILDDYGNVKKFIAIDADITELKKAEIAIKKQNEEIVQQKNEIEIKNTKLQELDGFKQGMTSMIVHDLKNPLNLILNVPKSVNTEKQISIMQQSGKQMLNMVLNILDVHKYEEMSMKVSIDDKQFVFIVMNALQQVQFLIEQKEISIKNQINQGLFLKIEEEIIERVLVNLLTNAIKYTPTNGTITIRATPFTETFIKIEIEDTGEGIPEEKMHMVFQKFGQIVAKKSGGVRSTGLGLTFCKMAVEAHGGEIGVTSEVGKGTIFWFTLQIGTALNIKTEINEEAVVVESKIILTDDEKSYLQPIIDQLQYFSIYETDDVADIINKYKQEATENIQNWMALIEKYLITLNQEQYLKLLKID